jgi:aminocarboxymuconate-semialdehyde decarboxylase
MQRRSDVDATVLIADRPFRQLDNRSWEVRRRVEDMDRDGVAVQAISPMPELLSYWFADAGAELFCDFVNADLATQVASQPDRFVGLGAVPMQNTALTLRHLDRIKSTYGLAGVEIGSNVNGALLGEARFDPIFEAAADLGLAVFVHALHPIATDGLQVPAAYTPMIGFPIDTAMAAASLLLAGTLERYPNLRIGFSHGGGALAPALHRLEFGWGLGGPLRGDMQTSPSVTASKFYYDSNVYEPRYLSYIAEHLAPGHVFLGTDYPYPLLQPDPVAFAKSSGLEGAALESLLSGAAHTFLNVVGA